MSDLRFPTDPQPATPLKPRVKFSPVSVTVRVPATSANLGPGFDCLGIALDLQLEVTASLNEVDQFIYQGKGQLPDEPNNLMHQGFRRVFAHLGKDAPKVRLEVNNPIPLARGLGSSSAALTAGLAAANHFAGTALSRDDLFQLAAKIEGHPDNVAPAVYGGYTVAALQEDGIYLCRSLPLPESWQFLFAVPAFELLTSEARRVLPATYSRDDLIFNSSRAALWSLAVAQNEPGLLRAAHQDRAHEPYREPLIPGLAMCRAQLYKVGAYAAYLSGAGPTLGVICSAEVKPDCHKVLQAFVDDGRVLELRPGEGYELRVDAAEA